MKTKPLPTARVRASALAFALPLALASFPAPAAAQVAPGAKAAAAAAGTATAASAGQPRTTDMSRYEKTYPWAIDRSALDLQSSKRKRADWNIYEDKVVAYTLPDTLALADGAKVTTAAMWEQRRRPELLELFRREMYGYAPPRPEGMKFRVVETDSAALAGRATLKRVAISFPLGKETFAFHVSIFLPKARTGAAPLFLMLNHRAAALPGAQNEGGSDYWPVEYAVGRGYAMALIATGFEVDPDKPAAAAGVRQFYRQHHPQPDTFTWGTLGAWAWSASRAMDYFETDADVDARRVAVIGHSRSGKTALWAGVQDTRFALVCANNAGEGGPALTRRNFGETLGQITQNFPHWFTPGYERYAKDVAALPFDQHELVALVAPRGYHGADGTLDFHADPRGSWLALVEASRVWSLFDDAQPAPIGMPLVNALWSEGPLAYHLREGEHALNLFDWKLYLDHADRLFAARR